jgi:hypothetical protein
VALFQVAIEAWREYNLDSRAAICFLFSRSGDTRTFRERKSTMGKFDMRRCLQETMEQLEAERDEEDEDTPRFTLGEYMLAAEGVQLFLDFIEDVILCDAGERFRIELMATYHGKCDDDHCRYDALRMLAFHALGLEAKDDEMIREIAQANGMARLRERERKAAEGREQETKKAEMIAELAAAREQRRRRLSEK